jgi:hypothetical protein
MRLKVKLFGRDSPDFEMSFGRVFYPEPAMVEWIGLS